MIERPKMVLAITIISIVGLGLMYAYVSTMDPMQLSLSELGVEHEGKLVEVSGIVVEARALASGAVLLTLVDMEESGSGIILLGADLSEGGRFVPGDHIRARGIVEVYRDTPQIVPSSKNDVLLLERPTPLRPSPLALMGDIHLFEGLVVELEGVAGVEWFEGEYAWFLLEMEDGLTISVRSSLDTWGGGMSGVSGTVVYDSARAWWYLDTVRGV